MSVLIADVNHYKTKVDEQHYGRMLNDTFFISFLFHFCSIRNPLVNMIVTFFYYSSLYYNIAFIISSKLYYIKYNLDLKKNFLYELINNFIVIK